MTEQFHDFEKTRKPKDSGSQDPSGADAARLFPSKQPSEVPHACLFRDSALPIRLLIEQPMLGHSAAALSLLGIPSSSNGIRHLETVLSAQSAFSPPLFLDGALPPSPFSTFTSCRFLIGNGSCLEDRSINFCEGARNAAFPFLNIAFRTSADPDRPEVAILWQRDILKRTAQQEGRWTPLDRFFYSLGIPKLPDDFRELKVKRGDTAHNASVIVDPWISLEVSALRRHSHQDPGRSARHLARLKLRHAGHQIRSLGILDPSSEEMSKWIEALQVGTLSGLQEHGFFEMAERTVKHGAHLEIDTLWPLHSLQSPFSVLCCRRHDVSAAFTGTEDHDAPHHEKEDLSLSQTCSGYETFATGRTASFVIYNLLMPGGEIMLCLFEDHIASDSDRPHYIAELSWKDPFPAPAAAAVRRNVLKKSADIFGERDAVSGFLRRFDQETDPAKTDAPIHELGRLRVSLSKG